MGEEPQSLKPSVVSQHIVPPRCIPAAFPCPFCLLCMNKINL